MARQAIETIWHFIGQFHIADLLVLPALHYSGAPVFDVKSYVATTGGSVKALAGIPDERTIETDDISLPVVGTTSYRLDYKVDLLKVDLPSSPAQVLESFSPISVWQDLPDSGAPRGAVHPLPEGDAPAIVNASFTDGETQVSDVLLRQLNMLVDRDTVLNQFDEKGALLTLAADESEAAAATAIDAAMGAATRYLPEFVAEIEGEAKVEGVTRESVELDGGSPLPFPEISSATGSTAARIIDVPTGNGQFLNGDMVDAAGQTPVAQYQDLLDVLESVSRRSDSEILHDLVDAKDETDNPSAAQAESFVPDVAQPADVASGLNTATNFAVINDFSGAAASRIVMGDHHATTAIVQLNVHAPVGSDLIEMDAAASAQALTAIAQSVETPEAQPAVMQNEASFVASPGELFGLPGLGGPGTLEWHIDYINGSVYDITTLYQRNYGDDSDITATQMSNAHYVISTGDNDQLNIAQIADLGSDYELVIVQGDWCELNAIVQINMLVNDTIPGLGFPDGLLNDAAIANTGGSSPIPLNDQVSALVEAIASKDANFEYSLAMGLPGNGDGVFDVLYISEDYIASDLIVQTNVLVDVDTQGADSPLAPQGEGSQGNTLSNVALINNVDSLSHYQVVGGETYEEAMLVQANLMIDENGDAVEVEGESGAIHPDVIATLAAMAGVEDDQSTDIPNSDGGALDAATQPDVLGGMIS